MNQMSNEEAVVLVVEDEESLLDMYGRWLEDEYEVRLATTAPAAEKSFDESVDVVLLDRKIPGLSGGDLLTEFRGLDGRCRVAMVTGVEPDFDIIDMGFDDYLTKPVTSGQLTDAVARLLRRDEVASMTRQLFTLARKRSVLQSSKQPAELQESEEFARLEREITRLRGDIDTSLERIGSDEMVSLVREFEADADEPADTGGEPD